MYLCNFAHSSRVHHGYTAKSPQPQQGLSLFFSQQFFHTARVYGRDDSGACVSSDGVLTLSPSAEQQELIRLYHYLEYYRSRHFDY